MFSWDKLRLAGATASALVARGTPLDRAALLAAQLELSERIWCQLHANDRQRVLDQVQAIANYNARRNAHMRALREADVEWARKNAAGPYRRRVRRAL
jgi:hypothetical protein